MPISPEEYNFLEEAVGQAEDLVRLENPLFISGFCIISMQAHRIESTMIRLQGVKDNLKEAEEILLEKIAELCKAVPQYTPKGASHSRRMLRNPPLFRKLVAAQALNDADDGDDTEEDSPIAQALRNMSIKDAKVEFERYDQRLRYKQQGIQKLSVLVGKFMGMLQPRIKRLRYLENVGKKWTLRLLEAYDIEKVEKAQKIVTESSVEIKMINGVLDLFPDDFTKLLEVEAIGSGYRLKRKAKWMGEGETPKNMNSKRARTEVVQDEENEYILF